MYNPKIVRKDISSKDDKDNTHSSPNHESAIENILFTQNDIIYAINDIDTYSGTSDQDIPAKIIKECKYNMSKPIYMIWRQSMKTGIVPDVLKIQIINPIFKKGARPDPGNYRPISLTSHVIKTFERIIRKRLNDFLEVNNKLSPSQHGFRKGRSCLPQLLGHFDNILQNLNRNHETDVIYLDYARAFDKVDFTILLRKLQCFGVQDRLFKWIKNFPTNRKQAVVINGKHSKSENVISGVPQGSVLTALLFIMYINDLSGLVKHSSIGSFADDTRVSKSIASIQDTIILQDDLTKIIEWSQANSMQLHEEKFEMLSYQTKGKTMLSELPFSNEFMQYKTKDGHIISQKPLVRHLGVHLSDDLTWKSHINIMLKNARNISGWILSVFGDRHITTMLQLYKTMIGPHLEYCCQLWNPHLIKEVQAIEKIQQVFTKKDHRNGWSRLLGTDKATKIELVTKKARIFYPNTCF